MSTMKLDVKALYGHLNGKCASQGRSWRWLGKELGMSQSVFTRMKVGRRPDADALVTMIAWLEIPLTDVTRRDEEKP